MASEIRVNQIQNRSGLSTVTFNDEGLNVVGVVTAISFSGSMSGATGTFSGDVTIDGDLGVGGTITYEDVARVDATGISTFREGFKLGPLAGIALTAYKDGSIRTTGIITASSFVGSGAVVVNNNADNRIITGSATAGELNAESSFTCDGNALFLSDDKAIKFGSNLRMQMYTDGSINYIKTATDGGGAFPLSIHAGSSERLRIDATGNVHLGDWSDQSTVYGKARLNIRGADEIATSFALATSYLHLGGVESTMNGLYPISFGHTKADSTKASSYIGAKVTDSASYEKTALVFATRNSYGDIEPSERLRISQTGDVSIGTVNNSVGGAPSSGTGKFNVYHTGSGGDDWAMQVRQDSGTSGNGIFVRAGNGSSKMALDVRAYDEANKLLQVNGAGHVQTPLQPRASVKIASTTTLSNAKVTNWASPTFNIGSFWDTSNHRFVAPVQGYYLFGGTFRIGAPGKIRIVQFKLQHYNSANQHTATYGSGIGGTHNYDGGSSGYDHPYVVLSQLIQMDHNSYIELHCGEVAVEHTSYIQVNDLQSHMWGMLIA